MQWYIKEFKELDTNEIYEILKLRSEVFIVEQQCVYQDIDGKDDSSYHLFALDKGMIAAYLRILEKGSSYNEISIGRVLIAKNYRGKGLGRELMLKAIDFIDNTIKEDAIRISAQEYLVKFYRNLGFDIVSDVYLEDGIPHIEMLYKKGNKAALWHRSALL